jgi:hypothetical protein
MTGPFTPAEPWWMWAAVALEARPVKVGEPLMEPVLRLTVRTAAPAPGVATAGTSCAPFMVSDKVILPVKSICPLISPAELFAVWICRGGWPR